MQRVREKIEEETRKRGEEREAAVEAARIAKEQETTKIIGKKHRVGVLGM